MLNALQHICFAAPVAVEEKNTSPPRETMIIEKDEQVEGMDIEEEEDWIEDLMGIYASKGLEAVLTVIIYSKDQKPPPVPCEEHIYTDRLDEEWTQELTRDKGQLAYNVQQMDQDYIS
ncbi:unnamed protein product [Brassica rapa]|uniref:Uncharacterized protein n=2 Tax=Brassica TaxID=3705 RepID=A0A3P6AG35_BRACM|nr:unnamed protein product [Brassica napus]CAG7892221.1 unnamed protein product [Brassica rapa]CDY53454.1 BnaA02g06980D [Brassica napus]VDC86373.1 unnamed protein product [Brassica rapa]